MNIMAVQTEQFQQSDVALTGVLPGIFDGLFRRRDGRWMFRVLIDGEAVLPDGRRIRISRHIGIPATEQIGRKGSVA